jgi:hypothetical protein
LQALLDFLLDGQFHEGFHRAGNVTRGGMALHSQTMYPHKFSILLSR